MYVYIEQSSCTTLLTQHCVTLDMRDAIAITYHQNDWSSQAVKIAEQQTRNHVGAFGGIHPNFCAPKFRCAQKMFW